MQTVVAQIIAGLGNQLFQYATARAVALRYGCELVLDLRQFKADGFRAFGLDHFKVNYTIDDRKLPPQRDEDWWKYFLWRRLRLSPRKIRERDEILRPEMKQPAYDIYLEGYWQSETYFKDVESAIREDLQFAQQPDDENARLLDALKSRPSVSLHVRRGDYLLPEIQRRYGSCSLQYYRAAVEFVANRAGIDPVVYVFSDDPGWVRDNVSLNFETRVIGHNGPDRPQEDLRLMSGCHHHIIANSSFSWWGAWLNPNPGKCVVAPKRWFINPAIFDPVRVPDSWHTIDN